MLNQSFEAVEFVTRGFRENTVGQSRHTAILRVVRDHAPDAAAGARQLHAQAVLDRLARDAS
ncbi:MAG: hypothetical protein AB7F89_19230 [Pirellulaceae bacterium]